jgi:hypothetical protein
LRLHAQRPPDAPDQHPQRKYLHHRDQHDPTHVRPRQLALGHVLEDERGGEQVDVQLRQRREVQRQPPAQECSKPTISRMGPRMLKRMGVIIAAAGEAVHEDTGGGAFLKAHRLFMHLLWGPGRKS